MIASAMCANPEPILDFEQVELKQTAVLRRAVRNGNKCAVLYSPSQYAAVLDELNKEKKLSSDTLANLAVAALGHIREFDSWQESSLAKSLLNKEVLNLSFHSGTSLRYGENSHQSATFFQEYCQDEVSLANAEQLHGKELSYNNIVDADAALEMVREFTDVATVAIIKHLNPCGLATGANLCDAFTAAWEGDPVSAFGSVIACNRKVDLATAEFMEGRFVEILLAPGFEPEALEFLRNKSKNIRLLQVAEIEAPRPRMVYKHVIGGMLAQDRDVGTWDKWECVTKAKFPAAKAALARFTWMVTKHTKSNAIVMVYEYAPGYFQVLGLGPGQPNRIDSNQRLCQPRVRDNVARMELPANMEIADFEKQVFGEVVMGSDAFFPFADNIEASYEAGVRYIVQPGGSVRDDEVIAKADELGIAMIFTGMRHFRH